MTWIIRLSKLAVLVGLLTIIGLVGFYFYIEDELPTEQTIRDVRFQIPMKVYTADGELISQFGEKRRTPLLYKEFPKELIDAILATEDSRFYDHYGIDPIGVLRAAFDAIVLQKRARGASTITMQLARNVFLTLDRTVIRKVKEIYIAIHIEQLLGKEEILTLYLNKIYFGNRAYGAAAAAQVYYGKSLNELTLAQIATIAGLPKAPSNYNPLRSPERAKSRRNVVLGRMLAVGAIDQATYDEASSQPITAKFHGAEITAPAPYIAEEVRKKLVDMYGKEEAYTAGFNVYTTINSTAQRAAQKAVINNIHAYDERHGYRGPEKYLWHESSQSALSESTEEADVNDDSVQNDDLFTADNAWTEEQITEYLADLDSYGDLIPAIVTNITDKSVYVYLQSGRIEVLDWDAIKWARPYISDVLQGSPPNNAGDVVQPGALIWVRNDEQGKLKLSQIPEVSSALISLNPINGDVIALVGGYDFSKNQYNRVTQAKRQVGSNIKPFIYSAAIDKGMTLATLINDAPINKWDKRQGTAWRPENSPATYDGPTRIRLGLAQSKNVMAVRLMRAVGLGDTIDHLAKFGFDKSELPRNESLSLGSASITPIDLITGMSAFANGGFLIEPNVIDRIENPLGDVVYRPTKMVAQTFENVDIDVNSDDAYSMTAERIISKENAFLISEAMNSTVYGGGNWSKGTGWNGTAWRAAVKFRKRRDLSGKTGTTNNAKDTWFTGFNKDIIATTWVGFDDPGRDLGNTKYNTNLADDQMYGAESGAKTALPAWIEFMEDILPNYQPKYREIPEGIVSVRIDRETGLLSRKADHTTRFEYFMKGTEPTEYVDKIAPVLLGEEDDSITDSEELF